jgi:hypothetical protein
MFCIVTYLKIAIDKLFVRASDSSIPGHHVPLSFLRILIRGFDLKSENVELLSSVL